MIVQAKVSMGCDPELFLSKDGAIIGAEKVVPETGIVVNGQHGSYTSKGVVLDGVQIELHPGPSTCRAILGGNIAAAFRTLNTHLAKQDGVTASFDPVIEVSKEELDSLSDKSKALGCGKSENLHTPAIGIQVDPATYLTRSAGGHIHLGLNEVYNGKTTTRILLEHRKEIVLACDYLVGNTSVLFDRDPNAAKRREVYGRAGEHREPAYGVEYRVLSNWWLRSYQTMSLVMGLARMAASVVWTDLHKGHLMWDPSRQTLVDWRALTIPWVNIPVEQNLLASLIACVPTERIVEAINTNNFQLAAENWAAISLWIYDHIHPAGGDFAFPIHRHNLWVVRNEIDQANAGAVCMPPYVPFLTKWFKESPIDHWATPDGDLGPGWEKFIDNHVKMETYHKSWRSRQ